MTTLRVDFETRSDIDLKKRGPAVYFASPHWAALICCYSIDGSAIRTWTYLDGPACPEDLRSAIEAGATCTAFNAGFERQCFAELARRQGWPAPAVEAYRCTAVAAAAMALPRSLDGVATVLQVPVQKDKSGADLIKFFSMPVRRLKKHAHLPPGPIFNDPAEHPEQFAAFARYCATDVETEAAVAARLFPLSADEQEMYTLDQVINSRGIRVDVPAVRAALALATKAKAKLEAELLETTGGAVTGINKGAELSAWLRSRGIETDSVAKDVVVDLLERVDLPEDVERVLQIRQEGAKSSIAKFEVFLDRVSNDGRVRHSFVMNAASTGRWSSRGVQLHNMPRPRKVFGDAMESVAKGGQGLNLETLFDFIGSSDPDVIEWMYGPKLGQPLPLLSDALKSFLMAEPGKEIVAADYSGIEDAVGMWLAGETWALDAMREINADKSKPDMYRLTAEGIYGEPIAKSDTRRQVGKVSRLALAYQGGVPALFAMSRGYGLKLHTIYEPVWASADEERRERAVKRYERCLKRREAKTDVLSREGWIAGELVKIGYRAKHPAVEASWGLLGDAMREAVQQPGSKVSTCRVTYLVANGFLWCRLPSGRCLAYAEPRLRAMSWFKDNTTGESECIPTDQAFARQKAGEGQLRGEAKPSVTALGVNSVTLKFERFGLYGGIALENVDQATAACLLRHGIKAAERAGYPVIGHVHDEIITEVPAGWGDLRAFEALICDLPAWADGLPLTASGFRGTRLKKD